MSKLEHLTIKEYAKFERVHETTVYRWIQKGVVNVRKTPSGRTRIVVPPVRVLTPAGVRVLSSLS